MIEPQPSIYPWGIRIDEPIGTLTDIAIALVCFYAFNRLNTRRRTGQAQLYFRYYFLLLGIATLIGGITGHGFLYALSFGWKLPGWIIGMVSVTLIERSAIAHARSLIRPRIGKFFLILNLIELVIIMTITISTLNFKWVEYHSAYGLAVIVFPFHAYTFYKTRDPGSRTIILAVVITGIASIIFVNELSVHTWFNSLDMSHVLLALAAYIMYQGALRLNKRKGKNPEMELI